MICYGFRLPTRIPERLSVNLGLSLEPQTEAVIGCHSKVEQLSYSPGSHLATQTTVGLAALSVSFSGQQTEEKPGCLSRAEQTTIFREFPAPVPVMERPWVTVVAFSGEKRSDKFNYPYGNSLFQTAAAREARIRRVGPLLLCRRHPRFRLFPS